MLNLPPFPELPEAIRGRQLAVIDGAVLGSDDEATEILAELRQLAPEIDTFARGPAAALVRLHMDPEGPTPATSTSVLLRDLPDEAIETFLALTGPGSGSSLLAAELRQLGGAVGRRPEDAGALAGLDEPFLFFGVGIAATPEMGERAYADATAVAQALAQYASGRDYLSFTEVAIDMGRSFEPDVWQRLREIRHAVDPAGLLHGNHQILGLDNPPAS
jgi:hypothetical protein